MPVLDHTDAAPALKEKGNAKWIWFFFTFVLVFILVLYYFSAIKKEFLLPYLSVRCFTAGGSKVWLQTIPGYDHSRQKAKRKQMNIQKSPGLYFCFDKRA